MEIEFFITVETSEEDSYYLIYIRHLKKTKGNLPGKIYIITSEGY